MKSSNADDDGTNPTTADNEYRSSVLYLKTQAGSSVVAVRIWIFDFVSSIQPKYKKMSGFEKFIGTHSDTKTFNFVS